MIPSTGRTIWNRPAALWAVGLVGPADLREVTCGSWQAVIVGNCLATNGELEQALSAAVNQRRPELLQRLPGAFGTAINDGERLHLITDRAGLHPWFYGWLDGGIAFASNALPLAALIHRGHLLGAIDSDFLASRLFLPDLDDLHEFGSPFRDIQRVGPDRQLSISSGCTPQVRRLPLEVGCSSLADGATSLRTALLTAINRRVESSPGLSVDLSGGLDSSSLALLASQAGGSSLAITYVDPHAANDEDVYFARKVADAEPMLRHVHVQGDSTTLPFTNLDTAPLTDEPSLDSVIIARTRARLAPAVFSDCHLAGDGGDVVLAGSGLSYLGDLARTHQHRRLRHEADGWARLRHQRGRAVRQAAIKLARATWPGTLTAIADKFATRRLCLPERGDLSQAAAWTTFSPAAAWGTETCRRFLADRLRDIAIANAEDPGPDQATANSVAIRAVRWHGGATRTYLQMARQLGIPVHVPFLDGQVIDACQSVPIIARTTVDSAKPLLAEALRQRLPGDLLNRRTKGDYSAGEYRGLRANGAHLSELVDASRLATLSIIDVEGPRAALTAGSAGAPVAMGALAAVIAQECWFNKLSSLDSASWWRPGMVTQETR